MNSAALVGWHADSFNPALASVRYRLLAPLCALQAQGFQIEKFDGARPAGSYRALLFCKSESPEAVAIARAARDAGTALIYDICDNVFAACEAGRFSDARLDRVRTLLSLATHVTFSTQTLADQFAEHMPNLPAGRSVIADALDTAPPPTSAPRWGPRRDLARLRHFLKGHEGALHCVWFGKSLGRLSGYVHVDAAVAELERFARSHRVTLTIISNSRTGFIMAAHKWRVPTHYMPWDLATFGDALALHRVALIPLENNQYTAGKTLNRPATALLAGLGVIADPIASYEELRPFCTFGDWQSGLARYARWDDSADAMVAAGQGWLADRYSPEAVARQWAELIERVSAEAGAGRLAPEEARSEA